jgi:hypothetical protein
VEEIEPPKPPKGILKKTPATPAAAAEPAASRPELPPAELPAWTWSRDDKGLQIKIQVPKVVRTSRAPRPSAHSPSDVPSQTHADIPAAALDVEPRRVLLSIPDRYALDIDLARADAELQAQATSAVAAVNAAQAMALKRHPRDFDVDGARAEWRVAEGLLVLAC